jgi:hypothetical protein
MSKDFLDRLKELADHLEAARESHTRSYPNGDWGSVNNTLGNIRTELLDYLPQTFGIGNAETVRFVRQYLTTQLENEMAIYNPQDDLMQDEVVIEITVALRIRADADVADVISEMDYEFKHDMILDSEIRDINTEF